uniref:Globin domain-containing protein n=1 Tax=Timema cristinae TaxID=61476 RepID=A0A7R9D3F3_TIMCR|nr:unnamed protein product [Timema cristinae]
MGVSGTLAVVIICSVMNQMIAGKQRSRTSLGLTDEEKRDFQMAWEIYRKNQKEPDDVINALITLFEERPEAQDYFPVVAGLPLSKMAEDAGVRNASLVLLEDITTFVRALDDDEEVERIIRSKRERLRARGVPVEVMFLYPAGVLAESVIANQDLDMAKRVERAITKTIFAVSAMLCGSLDTSYLGLTEGEKTNISEIWSLFKNQTNVVEGLFMAHARNTREANSLGADDPVFVINPSHYWTAEKTPSLTNFYRWEEVIDAMPEIQKMIPGVSDLKVDDLPDSPVFKDTTQRVVKAITGFLDHADDERSTQDFIERVARILHAGHIPFIGAFFGTSVLLIGAMSDHLGEKMTPETERAMLKMTFATYPLLVEVEKSYNIA